MYIIDGIAYASQKMQETFVTAVKPLDDMMMIVTFGSGEKRLYDASQLLDFPAFQPLKDETVFMNARWNMASSHGRTVKSTLRRKPCTKTATNINKEYIKAAHGLCAV